jgi:hypothetical protein
MGLIEFVTASQEHQVCKLNSTCLRYVKYYGLELSNGCAFSLSDGNLEERISKGGGPGG